MSENEPDDYGTIPPHSSAEWECRPVGTWERLTKQLAEAEARAARFKAWGLQLERDAMYTHQFNPHRHYTDYTPREARLHHLDPGDLPDAAGKGEQ